MGKEEGVEWERKEDIPVRGVVSGVKLGIEGVRGREYVRRDIERGGGSRRE